MASNFGELVLILGDLHIPHRARSIPDKFKRMLVPNKMQHVICTGNSGSKECHKMLRDLAPNVHIVSGDYEYTSEAMQGTAILTAMNPGGVGGSSSVGAGGGNALSLPETKVVQVGQFRIGVLHGHQVIPWGNQAALGMMRRKLDVDILVSGQTHVTEVVEYEGYYHINPGSITGAWSSSTEKVTPSFILLAVQGTKVVCYVYKLVNGEVDVTKTEFSKDINKPL